MAGFLTCIRSASRTGYNSIMDVRELVEIVETMAVQHAYPGFDVRSLKLGLPAAAVNSPAKLFAQALKQESALVKLAALRWFWDRDGVTKRYLPAIAACLDDADPWVRLEAARTIGRWGGSDEKLAIRISKLLEDSDTGVREAAATAIWKLGSRNEEILVSLRKATEDECIEVKWKAQKALRKLGDYAT